MQPITHPEDMQFIRELEANLTKQGIAKPPQEKN